jgi:hypothetical protein
MHMAVAGRGASVAMVRKLARCGANLDPILTPSNVTPLSITLSLPSLVPAKNLLSLGACNRRLDEANLDEEHNLFVAGGHAKLCMYCRQTEQCSVIICGN